MPTTRSTTACLRSQSEWLPRATSCRARLPHPSVPSPRTSAAPWASSKRSSGDEVKHGDGLLTNVPLDEQIGAVCRAQAARLGVWCASSPTTPSPRSPAAVGWDLQCVAEETITNAVRHGDGHHVDVELRLSSRTELVLSVTDNGSGSTITSPESAPQHVSWAPRHSTEAGAAQRDARMASGAQGTTPDCTGCHLGGIGRCLGPDAAARVSCRA